MADWILKEWISESSWILYSHHLHCPLQAPGNLDLAYGYESIIWQVHIFFSSTPDLRAVEGFRNQCYGKAGAEQGVRGSHQLSSENNNNEVLDS